MPSDAVKTVWDDIEDDVFKVLRNMSTARDYNYDYPHSSVVGWNGTGSFPFGKQNPLVGVGPGTEECEEITGTTVRHCYRTFGIEAWWDIDRARPDQPDASRTYQRGISDIEKALMADHTRGSNASDTDIISRHPLVDPAGTGRQVGAALKVRVYYRHAVGDLYTKL